MNRLNAAIENREIVRVASGRIAGREGIALGYNAQYDTVKLGFIDENDQYTGEYTKVGRKEIEFVDATRTGAYPVADAPVTPAMNTTTRTATDADMTVGATVYRGDDAYTVTGSFDHFGVTRYEVEGPLPLKARPARSFQIRVIQAPADAIYRVLGTTDDVTTCDLCGRRELRGTIVLAILDADGNPEGELYAGSTCGAKAAGRTGRNAAVKLRDEADQLRREALSAANDARSMLAHYHWDVLPITEVIAEFRKVHANAMWAPSRTDAEWAQMTGDMIERRNAQIAAGVKLGV
jgi:hypothetical protein